MVRRWSYVNQINKSAFHPYKTFVRIGNDVIFKETTVFRKDRTVTSLVRRKAWGRRRHINQWLLYHNVLADWSQDYMFFKKYLRFTLTRSLHKHSFFLYNVLVLLDKSSGFYPGFEFLNYVTITRKVSNYCLDKNLQQQHLFQFIKHSAILYCTSPNSKFFDGKTSPFATTLVYRVSGGSVSSFTVKPNQISPLLNIMRDLNFINCLGSHVEVYKVLTLLYFNKVRKA